MLQPTPKDRLAGSQGKSLHRLVAETVGQQDGDPAARYRARHAVVTGEADTSRRLGERR